MARGTCFIRPRWCMISRSHDELCQTNGSSAVATRSCARDTLVSEKSDELRIEPELSERLGKLAEELGVSVNELMGGIMWWAVENARPGEIHLVNKSQEVLVDQPGSVWFEGTCQLDFRGRRVVVDRLEQLIEKRERREGRKP